MLLLGCGDDPLEHLSVCYSAAGEANADTVGEDALMEHQKQSLLCLPQDGSGVSAPGQAHHRTGS